MYLHDRVRSTHLSFLALITIIFSLFLCSSVFLAVRKVKPIGQSAELSVLKIDLPLRRLVLHSFQVIVRHFTSAFNIDTRVCSDDLLQERVDSLTRYCRINPIHHDRPDADRESPSIIRVYR